MIHLPRGEFQNRGDVFVLEIWVVGEDLFARRTGREQIEDILNADPKAPDARSACANV